MYSKKAFKNTFWSLLLQFITIICGFIIPKLLISKFGSELNGIIVSITQFLSYISLLEAGFGPVIKSYMYKPISANDKEKIVGLLKTSEHFFKKIAYFYLIYIVLMIIFYPLIVNTSIDSVTIIFLIIIISFGTFIEYFYGITYMLFLQANQENHVIYKLQIVSKLLNLLFIIILIMFNSNILIIKLISSIVFVAKPIFQNIYVKKKYNIKIDKLTKVVPISQKKDGMAQHIAYIIHNNTDVVVLSIFTKVALISVYSIYLLIINSIRNILTSFTNSIEAAFGDMIAKNENEKLLDFFSKFECLYYIIVNSIFTCSFLLIIPFIKIYTKGLDDINYVLPLFAFLILLAEYIYTIRKPYNSLVFANGSFKDTMIGSFVEAFSNIVLSIILVFKYGITGVAIGTCVAMLIRTIEIIYFASKIILKRKVFYAYKSVMVSLLSIIISLIIGSQILNMLNVCNYFNFIIAGVITCTISLIVSIILSYLFYYNIIIKIVSSRRKGVI